MSRTKTFTYVFIGLVVLVALFFCWRLRGDSTGHQPDTKLHHAGAPSTQSLPVAATSAKTSVASDIAQSTKAKHPFRTPPAAPLPPSSLPLKDRLADLERQAKAGDGQISYALGMALRECSNMDGRYAELQASIESKEVDAAAGQAMLKDLDAKNDQCKGLTADQIKSYGDWIELAARHGNLNAQLTYPVIAGQLLAFHSLDTGWIEQSKSNTMTFLEAAANSGSVDALSQLAMSYHDGLGVQADLTRAYGYEYAVSLSGLSSLSNKVLNLWEQEMTPQQIQQGQTFGQLIYNNCCK